MVCIPLVVNHSTIYWLLLQITTVFHSFSLTKCVTEALSKVRKRVLMDFALIISLKCNSFVDINSVEFKKSVCNDKYKTVMILPCLLKKRADKLEGFVSRYSQQMTYYIHPIKLLKEGKWRMEEKSMAFPMCRNFWKLLPFYNSVSTVLNIRAVMKNSNSTTIF